MFNLRGLIVCLVAVLVTATDQSSPDTTKQLSAGNAKFTSAFYDLIRGQKGNLFFSPISIEALLALVHAGAGGKTATQIQQALHLPETRETSAKYYGELMETFKSDGNIKLNMANAIFAAKNFTIKQDYLDIAKNGFKAEADVVDFGKGDEAAKTINSYVAKNTGNKITELFGPGAFNSTTKLIMLSAIYFKADWAEKVKESRTKKGIFLGNEEERKEVAFMKITRKFNVSENEDLDATIVELPYKGNTVSMFIVVPNTANSLANVESKISKMDFNELTKSMNKTKVRLTMPKFKLEQTIQLKDILTKLGVEDLFSEKNADLSQMAEQPLSVSKAVQNSYIEVNERGFEEAITSVKMRMKRSLEESKNPIWFLVRYGLLILFVGYLREIPKRSRPFGALVL